MSSLFSASDVEPEDSIFRAYAESDHPIAIEAREFIDELWREYEPYADPHFVREIRSDFDARFWEMYLACTLLRNGYKIDSAGTGPDLRILGQERPIWIEAVAPTAGADDSPDRVPDIISLSEAGGMQEVPVDQIILRYRSAIQAKRDAYERYLSKGLVDPNDAYIVAINGRRAARLRANPTMPYIVRSVYPFGKQYVTFDRGTLKTVDTGYKYQPEVIKASGALVQTDLFLKEEYGGISGILFSLVDPVNRPERMGDDFVLIHNFMAQNSLPLGFIGLGREYWAEEIDAGFTLRHTNHA